MVTWFDAMEVETSETSETGRVASLTGRGSPFERLKTVLPVPRTLVYFDQGMVLKLNSRFGNPGKCGFSQGKYREGVTSPSDRMNRSPDSHLTVPT
jgi:hypothetical protein